MEEVHFKVGDIVKVIGYRPGEYAPGVEDDMGTEELFKSMVGKRYRLMGFDEYGHLELHPRRLHTVWIERDLVELASPKREPDSSGRGPVLASPTRKGRTRR